MEKSRNAIIGEIYYDISKQDPNMKFAYTWKDGEGNIYWSKHKTFLEIVNDDKFIEKINNRSVMKHELVLDIDKETKEEATIIFNELIERLKIINASFKAYFTGSKGYHIHLYKKNWLYMNERDVEIEKRALIEELGCDTMKAYTKTMIALEDTPHWKTGNKKILVVKNGFSD